MIVHLRSTVLLGHSVFDSIDCQGSIDVLCEQ